MVPRLCRVKRVGAAEAAPEVEGLAEVPDLVVVLAVPLVGCFAVLDCGEVDADLDVGLLWEPAPDPVPAPEPVPEFA